MVDLVMLGTLAAVVAVAVVLLVRRPAEPRPILRWSALAIVILVAIALAPYTVDDSGAAASYLLGVPVGLVALSVLAQWIGRFTTAADLVAALGLIAWGLLLGLGIGGVFLPVALLLIGSALGGRSRHPRRMTS